MKILLNLAFLVLAASAYASDSQVKNEETSLEQKIYMFQHRLIPQWVYTTSGDFFNDLSRGDSTQLKAVAADVVTADFANAISVTNVPDLQGILIAFPEPSFTAQCYFIFIRKGERGNFAVYTYEKAFTLSGQSPNSVGVVGGWAEAGVHENYWPRTYKDSAGFLKDIEKIAKQ